MKSTAGRIAVKPLRFVAAIAGALILGGCNPDVQGGRGQEYAPLQSSRAYNAGGFFVYEFTLTDGTRCVSVIRGGIACDWTRP